MTRFSKGDRVTFTASDGHHWDVSSSLLRPIREARNIS